MAEKDSLQDDTTKNDGQKEEVGFILDWLQSLQQFFINVSYVLVVRLLLMALS